jgi:hypothetical protein
LSGVLDKVLALRPATVVARLGSRSRLPVLSPHELVRALQGVEAALPCLPVPAAPVLPGVLAAARAQDSVLGLVCPHPLADRGAAERFVSSIQAAAEEDGHGRPLFLQAGPVRVSRAEPEALRPLEQGVFRLVDAGFSLVSLELSRLAVEPAVEAVRALAGPVLERELPLEVSLPTAEPGLEVEAARALLTGLRQAGLPVRWLRVPALAVEQLQALVAMAARGGAGVAVVAGRSPRALREYVAAGVRKVEYSAPFERLALESWPAEQRAQVEHKAQGAGLPPGELLGLLQSHLEPLTPAARQRLEALAFAEALEVLEALGARRTGSRSMQFLAQGPGEQVP